MYIMKKLLILALATLILGCQGHEFSYNPDESIKNNVRSIFGVDFPEWQDWNSSESGVASVEPGSVLLVCVRDTSGFPKLLKVNTGESSTLSYDIPANNLGLYLERPDGTVVKYRGATTRSAGSSPRRSLPGSLPSLSGPTDTYASKRGWSGFPKGTLWDMNPKPMTGASDYDEDFKDVMKAVIFTYFPNGRAYDNLPTDQRNLATTTKILIRSRQDLSQSSYHQSIVTTEPPRKSRIVSSTIITSRKTLILVHPISRIYPYIAQSS